MIGFRSAQTLKITVLKTRLFFYKFYEPAVAQNQVPEHSYKITDLTYQAPKKYTFDFEKKTIIIPIFL